MMPRRATVFETILVPPGARTVHTLFHAPGRRVTAINMDVATAAAFTIERIDRLSAGEVLAATGVNKPGCVLRVRNDSAKPAKFVAEVVTEPELDEIQHEIEQIFDDAWKRGGDPDPPTS